MFHGQDAQGRSFVIGAQGAVRDGATGHFRLIGPARTRFVAQILAAVIGAGAIAWPLIDSMNPAKDVLALLDHLGLQAAAVALDAPEGRPALPPAEGDGGEAMISLTQVDGQIRASSISRLGELVDTYPDETLALVRRWLAPAEVEG